MSPLTQSVACSVSCVALCEDSSMMAVGFSSSTVRVWSLIPQKLRAMKSADDLADIDKDAGTAMLTRGCVVVEVLNKILTRVAINAISE